MMRPANAQVLQQFDRMCLMSKYIYTYSITHVENVISSSRLHRSGYVGQWRMRLPRRKRVLSESVPFVCISSFFLIIRNFFFNISLQRSAVTMRTGRWTSACAMQDRKYPARSHAVSLLWIFHMLKQADSSQISPFLNVFGWSLAPLLPINNAFSSDQLTSNRTSACVIRLFSVTMARRNAQVRANRLSISLHKLAFIALSYAIFIDFKC